MNFDRIVPVLEDIASLLPPQKNISNGKADYGSVVTPHLSVVSLHFRNSANNSSVAMLFYKSKTTAAVQNGSSLSGERPRDEKLEAVPWDEIRQKLQDTSNSNLKSLQIGLKVPSRIINYAKSRCTQCAGNNSMADNAEPAVILTLFEKTELFTDKSLLTKKETLASSVIAMRVAGVSEPLMDLPENISLYFPYTEVSLQLELNYSEI